MNKKYIYADTPEMTDLYSDMQTPDSDSDTVSPEQRLINSYLDQLETIEREVEACLKIRDVETINMTSQKIDKIIEGLTKTVDKIKNDQDKAKIGSLVLGFKKLKMRLPVTTQNKAFFNNIGLLKVANLNDAKLELLHHYIDVICNTLSQYHDNLSCNVENIGYSYGMTIKQGDKSILNIKINDRMNLEDVFPGKDIIDMYPHHSLRFYQKYWKPIVESVGHVYISDNDGLVVISQDLPDIPKNDKDFLYDAWITSKEKIDCVCLSFRTDPQTWFFREKGNVVIASKVSKYSEQDYINAVVKCIDKNLGNLHGQTGVVNKIHTLADMILVDVDFGRGLGTIRLSEDKIEKVL